MIIAYSRHSMRLSATSDSLLSYKYVAIDPKMNNEYPSIIRWQEYSYLLHEDKILYDFLIIIRRSLNNPESNNNLTLRGKLIVPEILLISSITRWKDKSSTDRR